MTGSMKWLPIAATILLVGGIGQAVASPSSLLDPYDDVQAPQPAVAKEPKPAKQPKNKGGKHGGKLTNKQSPLQEASSGSSFISDNNSVTTGDTAAHPPTQHSMYGDVVDTGKKKKLAKHDAPLPPLDAPKTKKGGKATPITAETSKPLTGTDKSTGGLMSGVGQIKDGCANTFKAIGSGVVNGSKSATSKVVSTSKNAGDGISSGGKKVTGGIGDGAKAIGDGAKGVGGKIKDSSSGVADKLGTVPKKIGDGLSATGEAVKKGTGKVSDKVSSIFDHKPKAATEKVASKKSSDKRGLIAKLNPFSHKAPASEIATKQSAPQAQTH